MSKIHSVKDMISHGCQPLSRLMILKLIFRYGLFYQEGNLGTYKVCPALAHNTIELAKLALLKIEMLQDASMMEEEQFLSFIAEQFVGFMSEYQVIYSFLRVFNSRTSNFQFSLWKQSF